ncbi:vesicular amine transporter 1 [Elysia marginata]|uniref:Vesicular amine transporter 1 n=1 Tax=Elysia marginata TaxID=1093978 RepID=A0AAV4IE66_9GAST|nr:vesicular amine transporter 1 [Elysia marginata]
MRRWRTSTKEEEDDDDDHHHHHHHYDEDDDGNDEVFNFFNRLGKSITDAAIMPLLALLVELRHEAFYGCVYAVVQLAVCLAYFIGPSVAGLLVSIVGFPWLMRGMALINIIYCPLCYLLNKVPIEAEDGKLLSKTPPLGSKLYTTEQPEIVTEIDEARVFYGRLCEDDD